MRTIEVDMKKGAYLLISEEDYKEGIAIKFVGEMPEASERNEKHIRVYLQAPQVEGKKKTKRVPVIPTIPGHPNCHYGDCYGECHVVSCGIYQGYEKVPTLPDDYEPEYAEVEVDDEAE